jgi:hypothetical protein
LADNERQWRRDRQRRFRFDCPVSRVETIGREVFSNLDKVCKGFRVDAGAIQTIPPVLKLSRQRASGHFEDSPG